MQCGDQLQVGVLPPEQHGIEIDKKKIVMPEHIKDLGEYPLQVKVHTGMAAQIMLSVEELEQ